MPGPTRKTHGVKPWVFLLPGDDSKRMLDPMVQRSRRQTAQAAWKSREVPVLDETACTGCGLCCVLCPTDCLAMAGTMPWLPRPLACIGCAVCALVCPAAALEMKRAATYEEGE